MVYDTNKLWFIDLFTCFFFFLTICRPFYPLFLRYYQSCCCSFHFVIYFLYVFCVCFALKPTDMVKLASGSNIGKLEIYWFDVFTFFFFVFCSVSLVSLVNNKEQMCMRFILFYLNAIVGRLLSTTLLMVCVFIFSFCDRKLL